ncbi:MAG: choice-of-anchor tandem repeat GloVer-containing protein [Candidatus Cybelea sp.]
MRRWNLSHYAISSCVSAALLAGCGGSQPPIGAPGALPQTSALATRTNRTHYKVLYSFGAPPDGNNPRAGLIYVGSWLYGTTSGGGSYSCIDTLYQGCGTVFSVTLGGAERVLYSFGGGSDGSNPLAALIDVGGTLYGTTYTGGVKCSYTYSAARGCGTVFNITPSGAEKVLYRFRGFYDADGENPIAGLADVKGTLYGTTSYGGSCYSSGGCGIVYSITTQGEEKVLYAFSGGHDANFPYAGLIDVKGELYGTTASGGRHFWGAVFRITTGGTEKVLHGFDVADGAFPKAGLVELNGKLYGTTSEGGAYSCSSYRKGCGTVFSIPRRGGTENVLHSFEGGDGDFPSASLSELNRKFYGTTQGGGAYNDGTVFCITPSGKEKVLHSFGYGTDGRAPFAGLIDVNGTLYGTTSSGGTYNNGTVFALKP